MWIRNKALALALLLLATISAHAEGIQGQFQDGINGQFSNGIWSPNNAAPVPPPPPPFFTPVVVANTCNITLPVGVGSAVSLQGGGTCIYTATCGGLACTGANAITSWAITTQTCSSCFDIDNSGNLLGGTNAAAIAGNSTYTVTVTATNAQGTSSPLAQTINTGIVPSAPAVVAQTCNITLPVTNGVAVALQGGGNCVFTATCAGVACTGSNAITGWTLVTQSCAGCFTLDNSGNVFGGANAGSVITGSTYTMTVTASNNVGTSPQQVQTLQPPGFSANCLLAQVGSPILAQAGTCILVHS